HVESIQAELAQLLAPVAPRVPEIPFYSTVTNEVIDSAILDAGYWYRNLRQTVEFEKTTWKLLADGFTTFIESSAHPVLTIGLQETFEAAGAVAALAVPSLRRDEGGLERFLLSLGQAWAHGVPVDWTPQLPEVTHPVDLPTYPFQRQHYWLSASHAAAPTVSDLGPGAAPHPLLGAAVELPGSGSLLYTGRLSLTAQPWLGDAETLPGATFLELALRAGEEAGTGRVDELMLHEPLVIPRRGGVQLRVEVGEPEDDGLRRLSVHSRREGRAPGTAWTRHATAVLAADEPAPGWDLEVWPPLDAEPLDAGSLPGIRAAWRRDGELYAEIVSGEGHDPAGYALHPALLEAALGSAVLTGLPAGAASVRWRDVTLHAVGATTLRVRVVPTADEPLGVAVEIADGSGAPVATVGAMLLKDGADDRIRQAAFAQRGGQYTVEWTDEKPAPVAEATPDSWAVVGEDVFRARSGLMAAGTYAEAHPGLDALAARIEAEGAPAPEVVLVSVAATADGDIATSVRQSIEEAAQRVRTWLADTRFTGSRLVFLTKDATAASAPQGGDPAAAAVWGLIRAAQETDPDRFVLADTDGSKASWRSLVKAIAAGHDQLALRRSTLKVPRLAPAVAGTWPAYDPEGTVLVVGRQAEPYARRLAERHGVRNLLLAGARDTADLEAGLTAAGARVTAAPADPADPTALADALAAASPAHPVIAVVHAVDPQADAPAEAAHAARTAQALREAAGPDAAYVMLSEEEGATGAFLEAWARVLRSGGTTAVALSGRPGTAGPVDGELLDAATAVGAAGVVVAEPDFEALAALAAAGRLPALWRGLVRGPARRTVKEGPAGAGGFKQRLLALDAAGCDALLLDLVREHAASVLGHGSGEAIDADRKFRDMGFDSLSALALRNALNDVTALRMPPGVVFDQPTSAELAQHIKQQIFGR
uniref:acyltransferase domain-containing protein n=1 Tax=unclassified Streptomyces TaxID=2593676 RepID=UPI00047650FA